jgi:YjbE family integral membrane protein
VKIMEWSVLISVITINLLLSSDNALAIALASRNLHPGHQKKALLWGSICAIVLQILLTYIASFLLSIPYLKITGGIVLAWVAAKMIMGDDQGEAQPTTDMYANYWCAIKAIVVANLVMSLDNVLAVAAIAGGNHMLLGLGILMSFPIIMWGSMLISNLLEKFPVLLWLGAVFLGWTAGGIASSEVNIVPLMAQYNISHTAVSAITALGISFVAWREAVVKARVIDRQPNL